MQNDAPPSLDIASNPPFRVIARGHWLSHVLADTALFSALEKDFERCQALDQLEWDLSELAALDHIGAQLFWRAWGRQFPRSLKLTPSQQTLFDRICEVSQITRPGKPKTRTLLLGKIGGFSLHFLLHMSDMLALFGRLVLDLGRLIRHPLKAPWKEISANVYRTGFQALGITALVGLLIGIVLSYLTAENLRNYGGDLFIVNLLGVSIIRELGPMLAAILIAGRSGSAITAQLGVMRVTEEIDAMRVMGIPIGYRLILPKVLALAFTMPMIVIWTDVMALFGGMLSAHAILDMSPGFFLHKLPDAVSLANYWIGLGKGVVFGILISMVACHYGLRIKPNTESLGQGTTSSVVVSITAVIIADAFFAILFSDVGY